MIGNRCIGRWLSALAGGALLVLALAAPPAVARGPVPAELQGKFRGTVTGAVGEVSGEFTMVLRGERNGFTMGWPGRDSIEFERSAGDEMFQAAAEGRILDGDPAFWARLADNALIVYAMRIEPHGGYDIYTYIYKPAQNGIDLVIRHLRSGSEPLESKAGLERYDR